MRYGRLVAAAVIIGVLAALVPQTDPYARIPVWLGAIAFRDVGTWDLTVDTGFDCNVDIPAGATTGDMMLIAASWKDYSLTASIVDAAWTEITEFADGTVTQAAGVGSVKVGGWYKEHDGSESTPVLRFSAFPNINGHVMIVFSKDSGETWSTPAFATAAISLATNWTATASSDPGITGGDCLVGLVGFRDNSATMTRDADAGLDCDGITWSGNFQESPATHHDTSSGPDMSADLGYRLAASGTSSAAPTMAGTLGADETGSALWIRLRVTGGGGGGNRRRRFFMCAA